MLLVRTLHALLAVQPSQLHKRYASDVVGHVDLPYALPGDIRDTGRTGSRST
jgi:hypothetical protein